MRLVDAVRWVVVIGLGVLLGNILYALVQLWFLSEFLDYVHDQEHKVDLSKLDEFPQHLKQGGFATPGLPRLPKFEAPKLNDPEVRLPDFRTIAPPRFEWQPRAKSAPKPAPAIEWSNLPSSETRPEGSQGSGKSTN
jgi:hypothetical protein